MCPLRRPHRARVSPRWRTAPSPSPLGRGTVERLGVSEEDRVPGLSFPSPSGYRQQVKSRLGARRSQSGPRTRAGRKEETRTPKRTPRQRDRVLRLPSVLSLSPDTSRSSIATFVGPGRCRTGRHWKEFPRGFSERELHVQYHRGDGAGIYLPHTRADGRLQAADTTRRLDGGRRGRSGHSRQRKHSKSRPRFGSGREEKKRRNTVLKQNVLTWDPPTN